MGALHRVSSDLIVKISDFGLAKNMKSSESAKNFAFLPVKWMPPERLMDSNISSDKIDVVSCKSLIRMAVFIFIIAVGFWCNVLGGVFTGTNPLPNH